MDAEDLAPLVGLVAIFTVAILLAIAVFPTFQASDVRAFENPDDPTNIVVWIVIILAFTGLILLLAWKDLDSLIKAIVLGAVFITMLYAIIPLLGPTLGAALATVISAEMASLVAAAVGLAIAILLAAALWRYPEWYVVDAVGVLMSAGAAALFGVSLVPGLVIILLVALAVYDALAVYRTEHMVSLADTALSQQLPLMLVIPKTLGYSFLDQGSIAEEIEGGDDREALFLGLGDVVVPAILVVSGAAWAPSAVGRFGATSPMVLAFATLIGALAGLVGLMVLIQTGRAQAGLPLLNGGAILGYVGSLWWVYGTLPIFPFI